MRSNNLTQELHETVEGRVIEPGDPGYDETRTVFYTGFERRPQAIVRAKNSNDVSRVVSLAKEEGVELAVRSGGHSTAGHGVSHGGIVLDLHDMKSLEIDVDQGTAWAETGLTAGEYTEAAGAHGLATGFGDTPSVGIGGITLGGGVGFLHRLHGLTIDNLLAAEIVTADGETRYVDDRSHPDLFWAIRGGGGNFGVATRLEFRLHEVDRIVGGMLMLPATPEVIASFVHEAETAPDELSAIANVMVAPPMPFIPAEHHGKLLMMALVVYTGGEEAGEQAVTPFRSLADPLMDTIQPIRYSAMYQGGEEPPHPVAMAVRNFFTEEINEKDAAAITEQLQVSTAPMRVTQIRVLGGAVDRVSPQTTAYAHRGRKVMVNVAAAYEDLNERPHHETWVDQLAGALRKGEPGAYANFLGDEGEARVREAYPRPTWDRLVEVKKKYDPTNLFRLNQNIPPE